MPGEPFTRRDGQGVGIDPIVVAHAGVWHGTANHTIASLVPHDVGPLTPAICQSQSPTSLAFMCTPVSARPHWSAATPPWPKRAAMGVMRYWQEAPVPRSIPAQPPPDSLPD